MGTVWVTGIAGFLGSNAARRFEREGWLTAGIGSHAHAQNPVAAAAASCISGAPALIDSEISPESLERLAKMTGAPNVVVHSAGSGAVGPSLEDPMRDFQRAVGSTAIVLDHLRRFAPKARLILPSSAAIYGVQRDASICEDTVPNPVSPYGAHKLASEIICRQANVSFGQPGSVIRFFSLYGPGLRKQLLWDLAQRLKAQPDTLTLHGKGDETRDLLFINDAVDLIWQAAHWDAPFVCVNGGTGVPTHISDVAKAMIKEISPSTQLKFNGTIRPGDPRFLCADTQRLQDLGFTHKTLFAEGVRSYATWFREGFR